MRPKERGEKNEFVRSMDYGVLIRSTAPNPDF
jgi:hypothetical protein